MTNDLKAKSEEFIELGKKATQNVIEIIDADDVAEPIAIRHYGQVTNRKIYESDAKFYPELFKEGYQIQYTPPTDEDWDLWKNAQSMSAHIAKLQKRVDDFEARLKELRRLSGDAEDNVDMGSQYYCRWKTLEQAVAIMTEGE